MNALEWLESACCGAVGKTMIGPIVDLIPRTVYRARVVLSGTGKLASLEQIENEFRKIGFTSVSVFSIDEPPADWPEDERRDPSGLFEKTRLVQGMWSSPAKTIDLRKVDPRIEFVSTWIEKADDTERPPARPPVVRENLHTRAKGQLETAYRALFGRGATPNELQMLLAVSFGEGGYGQGTYRNSGALRGTPDYGKPGAGEPVKGTNNWGASFTTQKVPCGEGSVEVTDTSPQLVSAENPRGAYQACLRTLPTPEEGAAEYLRVLLKARPSVLAVIGSGNADAVASAMYRSKYFLGFSKDPAVAIAAYAKGIADRAAKTIAPALGEPLLVTRGSAEGSSSGVPVGAVAGAALLLGVGGMLMLRKAR